MTSGGSHRWRVPPPSADALVRWPEGFGRRFMVFVDTEEEFDWAAPFSREARSISAIAALPAMHRRFVAHRVAPCYLCDYPILTDPLAIETLRGVLENGPAEIGAQLHPWVNPPHDEMPSSLLSFAGNLPQKLEAAKLDSLTHAITTAFGHAPRVFRAGRYGLGPDTLRMLVARGYRIDSSMRARHNYSAFGGPDFSAIGARPFRVSGEQALVEVPLTTIYTGLLRSSGPGLHRIARHIPRGRGLLARSGLLTRVPLTPEGVPISEACEAVRTAVGDGHQFLNFSFHSPSLVLGHTPYVRGAADLVRFDQWWDTMFALLDRLGVTPISVGELISATDS